MSEPFDIHPDFQKIPKIPFIINRWFLGFLNSLMSFAHVLMHLKYRNMAHKQNITGLDNNLVPVTVIKPEGLKANAPALVYFHGGAFIFSYSPQHFINAVQYAKEAQCCVVFVKYRLSPKHIFPAALNDCYAALKWTIANANTLGIDTNRIAVGGDSAGGNLAAGIAQKATQEDNIKLCGQLLVYPATDGAGDYPSLQRYANVQPFRRLNGPAIWQAYLGHPAEQGMPQYAAPLKGKLTDLPPAYVETAEFDPLLDQGKAYIQALLNAGVEVEANNTLRTVHGFDLLAAKSPVTKAIVKQRIEFLKTVFN